MPHYITGRFTNETLLKKLERYISEIDINTLIAEECPLNETLRQFWPRVNG